MRMRKTATVFAIALVWAVFGASFALAGDIVKVNDQIGIWFGPYGTAEGPFRITDYTTGADFLTFCIETHQYFYPTDWNQSYYRYNVTDISHTVITDPDSSSNILSHQAAYLYYHWVLGDVPALATTDAGTLNQLQSAIWYWEGEIGGDGTNQFGVSFFNNSYFSQPAGVAALNNAYGHVMALNSNDVWDGAPAQSFMVAQTPEPSLVVLLGCGLVGLVFIRRK